MVTIIFEAHGTTLDNERHVASGLYDVALSKLGEQQSREMGERYKGEEFDAVFCSDLARSYTSAQMAFGDRFPIIRDVRLNEIDYGDMTRKPSTDVDPMKATRINFPFPNGESYSQTTARMKSFLSDIRTSYVDKRVMVVGHRATQYALEYLINNVPLAETIPAPWKWQPGWVYELS